ncbi:MAG: cytochrome C [Campylobacterota bacterium]|nr:cytochrome C [Campylobacterota bacterium]
MRYILFFYISIVNLFAISYGELLFNGNCITCHCKTKSISAPSMIDIKQRYIDAFSNKDQFINYMTNWIEHPNKETSLMQDAITKYELMPELGFDKDTLKQISCYIYKTDFKLNGSN